MGPTSMAGDGFEQILGPAARRYFGDGYRRTLYSIHDFQVEESRAHAVAHVEYPASWSTKTNATRLVPHLSTIDAAILATRMTQVLLERTPGLNAEQIGRAWIRSLSIRSGRSPVEALVTVPIEARVVASYAEDGVLVTEFDQWIGGMIVAVSVVHERGENHPGERVTNTWPVGPMTDLFRRTEHRTSIEHLDIESGVLVCRHHLIPQPTAAEGLESAYWPAPTLVDCLVLAGQMAQVLIYESDEVDRDATSTLWMRRASFTATSPAERTKSTTAKMAVIDHRTMHREGRTVNSVRVTMPSLFGVSVEASLGYFGSASTGAG
jgi:hypothetical protein